MDNNTWDNLGKNINNIQKTIQNAVDSQDFQQLNKSITQMVNKTISQYQQAIKNSSINTKKAPEKIPNVYAEMGGRKTVGILKIIFGGIFGGGTGIALLVTSIIQLVSGAVGIIPVAILFVLTCIFAGFLVSGIRDVDRISRFRKYMRFLGSKTYASIKDLSRFIHKPAAFVKKDVEKMIDDGWFFEGHMDDTETTLITTDETYQQYLQTQKHAEDVRKEQEAVQNKQNQASANLSPEVREVLNRGNEFIRQIHESNKAIPGVEMSEKISKMERIVQQIFDRVQEHPEVVSDLRRMMDYYLPTTIKLLEAYEEMDRLETQGQNIANSKKEIEATLDTLNDAFEKLLDSIFKDTAWDVSSDISVLNTLLAQEGLAGSDF